MAGAAPAAGGGASRNPRNPQMLSFLNRHRLVIGLIVLAAVTAYGLRALFHEDWRGALAFWQGRLWVLGAGLALHGLDLSIECCLWAAILAVFGVRLPVRRIPAVFFSGFAGSLMPVQLGRLIRCEQISRMGLGRFGDVLRAEVILGGVGALGGLAVMAGALVMSRVPWAGVPLMFLAPPAALWLASWVWSLLPLSARAFPGETLRKPAVLAVSCLTPVGWILNSLVLHLVIRGSAPPYPFWQVIFMPPSYMLLGTASGVPGGVGVVETLLGATLVRWMSLPDAHVLLAVAAFRLITFWVWVGVGWLALLRVLRWPAAPSAAPGKES